MEALLGDRDQGVFQPRFPRTIQARGERAISTATTGLLLCAMATGPAAGQHCIEYTDYLHFVGSVNMPANSGGLAVNGDHAYVASPSDLLVLDISNAAVPGIVGSAPTAGRALDVAIDGTFAYVVSSSTIPPYNSTFQVVDVADPASPLVVGSVDTPDNVDPEMARSVAVAGTYAYVTISNCGMEGCITSRLEIIDISHPSSPAIIGSLDTLLGSWDVAVAGTHAYVATIGGLEVVDISSPTTPAIVTSVAMNDVVGVAVASNHLYAITREGLWIFDISNPSSPVMVGDVACYQASGLAVAGNYAYVSVNPGLQVVDVSNPGSPAIIGSVGMPDNAWYVAVAGNYAYLAGGFNSSFQVVDISHPTSPATIGNAGVTRAHSVAMVGDLAHVACENSLHIVDVSNPSLPVLVGGVELRGITSNVAVAGNYAYVVNFTSFDISRLKVVDVSNPASPLIVGSADLPDRSTGVAVAGNLAYVAVSVTLDLGMLQIFDVSNPSSPIIIGTMWIPAGFARCVAVAGNYAYLGIDSYIYPPGLLIVDISDPISPLVVGFAQLQAEGAYEVALDGDYAYVAAGSGLEVLDISNPASPTIIGSVHWGGAMGVTIDGMYAYTADFNGIQVIDISNPASPALIGGANRIYPGVFDVAVQNDLAFLADFMTGLLILPTQCQVPTSVETPLSTPGLPRYLLAQNHPNPFVAEAGPTAIGFTLGEQVQAKLRVFDASGRLVRVLIDEQLNVGPHTARWDGRNEAGGNAASGIYYYRLEAGKFSEARALVKLK